MPDLVLTATRLSDASALGDLLIVGPSLGTSVAELWTECVGHLMPTLEVVGWDLPGHGGSAPAANFSVADLADAVVRLTAEVSGVGRRCWYAGVSLGGAVGLELALRSDAFQAVAVIASNATIGEPASWVERATLVRQAGTSIMVEPSSQRWFAPGFADRQPQVVARLLRSLANTDRDSYAAACDALAEFDIRSLLHEIRKPVMLMPGAHDHVVSTAQATETADNLPNARVHVLAECGHLPPAEQPEAVASALLGFFSHDLSKASS